MLAENRADAEVLLDKAIVGCREDEVAEIRSLGDTLARWRAEILARHDTGASNGPTEGLNLLVKKVQRCGHGFRRFEHYRLRVLLHTGGITWPTRPSPPRIRTPCSPVKRVEPGMRVRCSLPRRRGRGSRPRRATTVRMPSSDFPRLSVAPPTNTRVVQSPAGVPRKSVIASVTRSAETVSAATVAPTSPTHVETDDSSRFPISEKRPTATAVWNAATER